MMALPALLNPHGLVSTETEPEMLRYPSDYQRAMTVLGRKEWPMLKKRLSSPDAAEVVVALNAYIGAILANQMAIESHDVFDGRIWPNTRDMTVLQERWDEMNRLRREARYAMRIQSIKRYDLMAVLVGKENLCVERPHESDTDYDDSDEDYGSE
jgi:hypothetical protein